jgi:hypothetical protein
MKRVLIIESEIVPRLLYQAKFQTAGFEVLPWAPKKQRWRFFNDTSSISW